MTEKLKNALMILGGACCLYCANDALDRHGDNGAVPDASGAEAAACCEPEPVEAPTIIFDGLLDNSGTGGCTLGPEWDISAFRTVIIHHTGGASVWDDVLVRHGAAADYIRMPLANLSRENASPGGGTIHMLDTRFGTSMQLIRDCQVISVTVVGYANR